MYVDTPRDYIGSVYEELLFGSNPLGWETLGTKETIEGASRETFLDYIGEWYQPSRMVVGLRRRGRRRPPVDARGACRRHSRPARPARPKPATIEQTTEPQVRIHRKDSDQANVALGVPSYPVSHPDRYVLSLLGTVLGTGMSSRLFLEVRERRGLAYYVFAFNNSFTDAGTLYAQAGVDLKRTEEAVKVIAGEFKKLADEPVPAEELEKARALAKGRFVLQTESPNGLLVSGLRREMLEGRRPSRQRSSPASTRSPPKTSSVSPRT